MLYMIIERFKKGKVKSLYERYSAEGRMMPSGIRYIGSWIDEKVETCYQVMESPSLDLIHEWISNWDDLCDFEIVRVITSVEARKKVLGR